MDSFEYRKELAKRVNALVVVYEFETGSSLKFAAVQTALEEAGVSISRQRWSYIKHGSGFAVKDQPLLEAITKFFGVDSEFLLDLSSPPSEDLQRRIDHVIRLRRANVAKVATRALGQLDPELAESLVRAIEESADPSESRKP
ncbi:hypothetical protein [Subtercola sp. YIM 133946]|uniref:hypothetical protein n=1 Tax=Subtercola sp. YIM 133946 TaxID=3118909 RepID=UPI002F94B33E